MTQRDNHGLLMPIALLCLVLLVFSGAAIARIMAAQWRSTLRVDADNEAASVLASAVNIVEALSTGLDSTGASRTPQQACEALHTTTATPTPDCTPADPATSTPAGAEHDAWTPWLSLPSRNGCDGNVLEGCWQARFSTRDIVVHLEGQAEQTLTGWEVLVRAAARCDLLPTDTDPAERWCEAVTDPAVLSLEPLPLPLYSSVVGTPVLTQEMIDAALAGGVVFGAAAAPAANTSVELRGSYGGIFINNESGDICTTAASGEECGSGAGQVITLEAVDVVENACSTDPAVEPAVLSWVGGTTQEVSSLAAHPGSGVVIVSAAQDDPTTSEDERSILITGDISAPATEPLLIVSGCHIVIDGPCIFEALIAGDPESAPQACDASALDRSLYDPSRSRRVPIALTNVILVTAGGVWAADLEPGPNVCPVPDDPNTPLVDESAPGYQAPSLTITGAVISGHAGTTSIWEDCDNNLLTPIPVGANGREKIVAGVDRIGSLPPADEWATADIAWWPGRDEGVWRRR